MTMGTKFLFFLVSFLQSDIGSPFQFPGKSVFDTCQSTKGIFGRIQIETHQSAPTTTITFVTSKPRRLLLTSTTSLNAEKEDGGGVQEYKNAATAILSNFMQESDVDVDVNDNNSNSSSGSTDPLANIDFDAPKISPLALMGQNPNSGKSYDKDQYMNLLAAMLDAELYEKEWFVTGNVNPMYFSEDFEFQDPDVKLQGIQDYARGVYKLFDQKTSRAEIISTLVNPDIPNTITVTWRLSGKVKIGPGDGLTIKPYICYTDFTVDTGSTSGTGLITFQQDRFDIPGWDILLSALFPFLIGKVTAQPAPPVEPRPVPLMPQVGKRFAVNDSGGGDTSSPFDKIFGFFK